VADELKDINLSSFDDDTYSPGYVRKRLAELNPVLTGAAVGDFTKDVKIPNKEDEFTELFVGVQLMLEVIRDQFDELKALNQALEAKADERSLALEEAQAMTHLGSWQWDITNDVISWSDELYRIYDMEPQGHQASYNEFLQMIHPADRERVSGIITQAFQTATPFEFEHRIVLASGEQRILQGKGKVDTDTEGKPIRMVGTSYDITEQKKADFALRQSDQRFKAVTRATSDVVYDIDLQDGSLWFNEALYTEYGYAKEDVGSTKDWWIARVHPDDVAQVESQMAHLLQNNKHTWDTEYRFQKADGSYVLVRNRAFLLRDGDKKPHRIIGSLLDITHQRQLERAKDEFMSLVSHQLRTPLTIIRVYSEMLSGGMIGKITPVQKEHVHKISDASVRLINLVRDMLDISRIELERIKIDPKPTDMNRLIATYIEELTPVAEEKQIAIRFKPDTTLPSVLLDVTVIGQIIYNLLENAINYTPSSEGHVTIRFTRQKNEYVFSVADNGIGIPEADQQHIFERFYRANNSTKIDTNGTGLGLYLVKLLVDAFGGKIRLKSTEGSGTTFFVYIPLEGMRKRA
jgi:PAS domain S-box-containing protein